ncbi:MAG: YitT family protein [Pyrinomonadaceae bacterium]
MVLILLGIFSAGFGLKGFLLSSHFIDGGVTGISMLASDVLGWPLSVLILVINLPFIGLGYRQCRHLFFCRFLPWRRTGALFNVT